MNINTRVVKDVVDPTITGDDAQSQGELDRQDLSFMSPGLRKVTTLSSKRPPHEAMPTPKARSVYVIPEDSPDNIMAFGPTSTKRGRPLHQVLHHSGHPNSNIRTPGDPQRHPMLPSNVVEQGHCVGQSSSSVESEKTLLPEPNAEPPLPSSDLELHRDSLPSDAVQFDSPSNRSAEDASSPSPSHCQENAHGEHYLERHGRVEHHQHEHQDKALHTAPNEPLPQYDQETSEYVHKTTRGSLRTPDNLSSTSSRKIQKSVLSPQNETARVTKSPKSTRAAHTHIGDSSSISHRSPTEEDLLLLLIRRQRSRDQMHAQLHQDIHRLTAENHRLKDSESDHQNQLDDLTTKWHAAIQNNHVREAEIEVIKGKYNQVKARAHSMQDEYSSLRGECSRLKHELEKLKHEQEAEVCVRSQLLEKVGKASEPLQQVSSIASELRQTSAEHRIRESLDSAGTELEKQKKENEGHTLRIRDLEEIQQLLGPQLDERHQEVQNRLTVISDLLQQHDVNFVKETVVQLAKSVEELQQNYATKVASSAQSSHLLDTIQKQYLDLSSAVEDVGKVYVRHHNAQSARLSSLIVSAKKLKPQLGYVRSLECDNLALLKKVMIAEAARVTAESDKNALQSFQTLLSHAKKEIISEQSRTSTAAIDTESMKALSAQISLLLATDSNKAKQIEGQLIETRKKCTDLESTITNMAEYFERKRTALKVEHATKLAEQSQQLQAELHAQSVELDNARKELETKVGELQKVRTCTTELTTKLASCQGEIEEQGSQLTSAEQNNETLNTKNAQLQDKIRDVTKVVQDQQRELSVKAVDDKKIERLQKENADLNDTLRLREQQINRLESNANESAGKIQDLEKKVLKAREIEADFAKRGDETQQLQSQLELAKKDASMASALSKDVEVAKAYSQQLTDQLDKARKLSDQIPSLERVIEEHEEELRKLREDLEDTRRRYIDEQVKTTNNEKRVQELQNKISGLKNEVAGSRTLREECRTKSSANTDLQTHIDQLKDQMKPLEMLINGLTAEEKAHLNEEVLLVIKTTIRRQSEHFDTALERIPRSFVETIEPVRPRGVATRSGPLDNQEVVVPDSQSQHAHTHAQHIQDSSDLSDPPDEADDFIAGAIDGDLDHQTSHSDVHEKSLVPTGAIPARNELRPGTSNDEMLLRSSDIVNWSPYNPSQPKLLVPTSTAEISPMRTRQGSQIRHGTPLPQTGMDGERVVNFLTPTQVSRGSHTPNSAAKRRQSSEGPEPTNKRRNINMKDLEIQSSRTLQTSSLTRDAGEESVYDIPTGQRAGASAVGTNMPAPGRKKKSTNSTRKNSKSAKMEAQFNAPMT